MSNKSSRALLAGKLSNLASAIGKNRGSGWAGSKAIDIDPEILSSFSGIDASKVLFVTGTNGTAAVTEMIYHILRIRGFKVISNTGGDNLIGGVAASLIKSSSLSGKVSADYYIFEVDESCVSYLAEQLPCTNILITNLQKGNLQRSGDPDSARRKIARAAAAPGMKLILNGDEPRSCSLADIGENTVFFSVRKHSKAFTGDDTFVTLPCPKCRKRILFDYFNNGGMGSFYCEKCGYTNNNGNKVTGEQREADYIVSDIDFDSKRFRINDVDADMFSSAPGMLANYAAAIAACREVADISIEQSVDALESYRPTVGCPESIAYKSKVIKCLTIEPDSPDSLQDAINIIAEDKTEKAVGVGLGTIYDAGLPYVNTFSAFDCDYSELNASGVRKYIFVTDTTAYDAANSFIYGGVNPFSVEVFPSSDPEEIFQSLLLSGSDNIYFISDIDTFLHMKEFAQKGK